MIYFNVRSQYVHPLEMQKILGINEKEIKKLELKGIYIELRVIGEHSKKNFNHIYNINSFHLDIPYDEDIYFSYNLENVVEIFDKYQAGLKKLSKYIREESKKNLGSDDLNYLSLSVGFPLDNYSRVSGIHLPVAVMNKLSEYDIDLSIEFVTPEK